LPATDVKRLRKGAKQSMFERRFWIASLLRFSQ
jgi:hypothetical protein